MNDSQELQPIFKKASKKLETLIDDGAIVDKPYANVVMATISSYLRARSRELAEKKFGFQVGKFMSETTEDIKAAVKKQIDQGSL